MPTKADESIEATALCPGCMRPVEGDPDYCPYCNAPLGLATMIDPYRRAKSLAFVYQRGAERPTTPALATGMAIFLAATLLTGLMLAIFSITSMRRNSSWDAIGEVFIGLVFFAIGAVGIWKTARNYFRIRSGVRADGPEVKSDSNDDESVDPN
jgi:hypothetical protein